MCRILGYLGVDPTRYDMRAAGGLPLTGSSFVAGADRSIHWGKVPRNNTADLLNSRIPGVEVMPASQFNAYAVLRPKRLLLTRAALDELRKKKG